MSYYTEYQVLGPPDVLRDLRYRMEQVKDGLEDGKDTELAHPIFGSKWEHPRDSRHAIHSLRLLTDDTQVDMGVGNLLKMTFNPKSDPTAKCPDLMIKTRAGESACAKLRTPISHIFGENSDGKIVFSDRILKSIQYK